MCTVFAWDHRFLFQSVLIDDWRPSANFVFWGYSLSLKLLSPSRSRFPLVRFELLRVANWIFYDLLASEAYPACVAGLGMWTEQRGSKETWTGEGMDDGPYQCAPLSHCWPLCPARCCCKIQEVLWKVGDQLHVSQHDLSNLGGHLSEKGSTGSSGSLLRRATILFFLANLLNSIQAKPVQICFTFHPEKLQSVPPLLYVCLVFECFWSIYIDRAHQARQQGPASGGQLGLNPTSQCRHDMEYHESRGASHVSWGHVFSGHQINCHEPDSWLLDRTIWHIDSRWLKVFASIDCFTVRHGMENWLRRKISIRFRQLFLFNLSVENVDQVSIFLLLNMCQPGFLLMLAFDSLYHSRAWVMLFLNVLQLLFSIVCLIQGTSFGASDILSWHSVDFFGARVNTWYWTSLSSNTLILQGCVVGWLDKFEMCLLMSPKLCLWAKLWRGLWSVDTPRS